MKKINRVTLSIGIPAYNEENNIGNIISAILNQKTGNYVLDKIIIASDGCTDKTVNIIKSFKSNKIHLINGKERKGKYYRLNQIFKKSKSDFVILVDADCFLRKDTLFKIIDKLNYNNSISLLSVQAMPVKPNSFFEKMLSTSVEIKEFVIRNFRKGKNVYAFRGALLVMKKNLYKQINIPNTVGTDAYIYFFAKRKKMDVEYFTGTKIYYRLPDNFLDHLKQSSRFKSSVNGMKKFFGNDIEKEYNMPLVPIGKMLVKYSFLKPIHLISYIIILIYTKFYKRINRNNDGIWHISSSTKKPVVSIERKSTKKLSLTVGIPTYNNQDNIENLVHSLINQSTTLFKYKSIIVYCDKSTDSTLEFLRKIKKNKLRIIEGKERLGFQGAFKQLIINNKSDVFVLINDDVLIKDKNFLNKLIKPFRSESNVGLVSGNPQPLGTKNFIQRACLASFNAYERARYLYRNGDNKYTCDGKILVLSNDFIKKSGIVSKEELGNVDSYLYLSCIKFGFTYKHVRAAVGYFIFPSTLFEYIQWNSRNNMNKHLLKKNFGNLVNEEYELPIFYLYTSQLIELIKKPLPSLLSFIVGVYSKYKARKEYNNFPLKWQVINSTKKSLF